MPIFAVLQLLFSWKEWEYRASGRSKAPPHRAVWNDGRDHKERTIMRIALRIALAASAALLT
ncbi:hypothetical protein, partial [Mesorhizobium sp. P5_C1]